MLQREKPVIPWGCKTFACSAELASHTASETPAFCFARTLSAGYKEGVLGLATSQMHKSPSAAPVARRLGLKELNSRPLTCMSAVSYYCLELLASPHCMSYTPVTRESCIGQHASAHACLREYFFITHVHDMHGIPREDKHTQTYVVCAYLCAFVHMC